MARREKPRWTQGLLFDVTIKDTKLKGNDYRVLNLLSKGCYSVIEIGSILNLPDPRSNIRYLRNAGYRIEDYWVRGKFAGYKMYFIHQSEND